MFDNIIKNEKNKAYFEKVIQQNKLNHTYLFEGEAGVGKKTFAYDLAEYILCEDPQQGKPCGTCKSCMLVKYNTHPDLIYIEKGDKAIKIDEIREKLVKPIGIKPMHSSHKVFIINDVETLDANSQNTLLKTIEEPQEYAKIILLTTNKNKLLPTVLSRCLTIRFSPLLKEDVLDYLINHFDEIKSSYLDSKEEEGGKNKKDEPMEISLFSSIEEAESVTLKPNEEDLKILRICTDFSNGSIGKALSLFANQDNFLECLQISLEQLFKILNGDMLDVFSVSEFIEKNMKENLLEFLMFWKTWFLNLIYIKSNQSIDLAYQEHEALLKQQANVLSFEVIQALISLIEQTYFKYKKGNISLKMLLDHLCLEIFNQNSSFSF